MLKSGIAFALVVLMSPLFGSGAHEARASGSSPDPQWVLLSDKSETTLLLLRDFLAGYYTHPGEDHWHSHLFGKKTGLFGGYCTLSMSGSGAAYSPFDFDVVSLGIGVSGEEYGDEPLAWRSLPTESVRHEAGYCGSKTREISFWRSADGTQVRLVHDVVATDVGLDGECADPEVLRSWDLRREIVFELKKPYTPGKRAEIGRFSATQKGRSWHSTAFPPETTKTFRHDDKISCKDFRI